MNSKIIFLFLFFFSNLLYAQSTSKSYWFESVSGSWESESCHPESIFRVCYVITEKDCFSIASFSANECFEKMRSNIPIKIKNKFLKNQFDEQFKACANKLFSEKLAKKYITKDNEQCSKKIEKLKASTKK